MGWLGVIGGFLGIIGAIIMMTLDLDAMYSNLTPTDRSSVKVGKKKTSKL